MTKLQKLEAAAIAYAIAIDLEERIYARWREANAGDYRQAQDDRVQAGEVCFAAVKAMLPENRK